MEGSESTMPTSESMLEWALYYASLGWRVFPVRPRGKSPAIAGWQEQATTDPRQITAWWEGEHRNANIGITTGRGSGVVVLDVDGEAGWEAVQAENFQTNTPRVRTGKGWHLYYRHPGSGVLKNKVRFGKDLDTRADGGLVVAPPSIHPDGHRYAWEVAPGSEDGDGRPVLPSPLPWALNVIMTQSGHQHEGRKGIPGDGRIPDGMRNDTLFKEACALRGREYGRDAIYAAISKINDEQCEPPLSEGEVQVLVDQAMKYAPGRARSEAMRLDDQLQLLRIPENQEYYADEEAWATTELEDDAATLFIDLPTSDLGHARRFLLLFGNAFRYNADMDAWLYWVGSHWEPCTEGKVMRAGMAVSRVAKRLYAARDLTNEQKEHLVDVVRAFEGHNSKMTILAEAKALGTFETTINDFDSNPMLVATPGGTYDADLDVVRPAAHEDLMSRCTGASYDDKADCPRWREFLLEVMSGDAERVEYLQRAIGYSATGSMVEQVFWILVGDGANGKSTFLRVVEAALGSYAMSVGFETFDLKDGKDPGPALAGLKGARFVSASEAEDDRVLAEARVKRITGGDPIMAKFLYQNPFTYRPTYKIWLAVNELPLILNPDFAMRRRVQVVEFRESFVGRSNDRNLEIKLLNELPGILNWVLDGVRAWREQGLNPPESVQLATDAHMFSRDLVSSWLDERVVKADAGIHEQITASALFDDFNEWCKRNNHRLKTSNWFGRRMSKLGYQREREGGVWHYSGVRLREAVVDTTGGKFKVTTR